MNYIVFDLEFNQAYKDKLKTNPRCPFEIIQIGSVKLDKNFKTIGSFNKLVKPEIYTEINPFVKELTQISEEQLNTSKPFTEIYNEFIDFIKDEESVLCIWGMADIKELFRNALYHKLDIKLVPNKYINLQAYASNYFKCPVGTNIGLSTAVDLLNIKLKNHFHNAHNDAYCTAEVLRKIYNNKIIIKTYEYNGQNRLDNRQSKKSKVDIFNLVKQFEKMFNRPMTEEEKKIIKLAYMMGKTNQFQSTSLNAPDENINNEKNY